MEGYIVQNKFVRTDIPKPSDKKDGPENETENLENSEQSV